MLRVSPTHSLTATIAGTSSCRDQMFDVFLQSAGADLAVLVKGRRDRWDDSGKTHSSLQECFGIGVVETTGTFRAQVAKLGFAS